MTDFSENTTDHHIAYSESLKKDLLRSLSILTPREKEIIELHYGLHGAEQTLEEIAEVFDCTKERVRQIREKALRRLKRGNNKKQLESYL